MARLEKDHDLEAALQGMEIIGQDPKGSPQYRLYRFKSCGHIKRATLSQVRNGAVMCKECREEAIKARAAELGLEVIGVGRNPNFRKLRRIECGHEFERIVAQLQRGDVCCRECLATKHQREAEAAGWELIGESRHRDYAQYRCKRCGTPRECNTGAMRRAEVRCWGCLPRVGE